MANATKEHPGSRKTGLVFVTALENESEQQVYARHGVTPEEIAIVEGTAP